MSKNRHKFDLIVIGGGVYGVFMALEASLRGLRVLVLERDSWGSGTTAGWLRILHGGLRYLQTADLPRFYESVRERRWFMQNFPDLIATLPCTMPLYRSHSHSPLLMRAALTVNDLLSSGRNKGLVDNVLLPGGRVLTAAEVKTALPFIEESGLRAGAMWHDAVVHRPQQMLLELLRWAKVAGCVAMDRTEALGIIREGAHVQGIEAVHADEGPKQFEAPVVVNMTGHASIGFAQRAGFDLGNVRGHSWAWNVLFDVPYNSASASAVTARRAGAQTFFIVPWKGRALVGTGHAPAPATDEQAPVPQALIDTFIEQVGEAAPGLGLSKINTIEILQGRLPVVPDDPHRLSSRPLIVDHAKQGCSGFFTVWGIKYTTARDIAQKLLKKAFGSRLPSRKEYVRPQ